MKKADIFFWASNDGEFLNYSDCFARELLEGFERLSKIEYHATSDWYLRLLKEFEIKKETHHEDNVLENIFRTHTFLDNEFAEKLNLFDILEPYCFTAKEAIGEAILHLCESLDMRFIIAKRGYISKDTIRIDFEVCCGDTEDECHKAIFTKSII
jgi:hypothetical protein